MPIDEKIIRALTKSGFHQVAGRGQMLTAQQFQMVSPGMPGLMVLSKPLELSQTPCEATGCLGQTTSLVGQSIERHQWRGSLHGCV